MGLEMRSTSEVNTYPPGALLQAGNSNENSQNSPTWKSFADWSKLNQLNQELKDITALYNLGIALGSNLNFKSIIQTLYKEMGRLLDISNFAIVLYNKRTRTLNFGLVNQQEQHVKPFSLKLSAPLGLFGHVLATHTPLLIKDCRDSNIPVEIEQIYPHQKIRSWLGAPILNPTLVDANARGIIAVWSEKPNAFGERELWLLSAVGTQAAIALGNAQAFEADQRQIRELVAKNTYLHENLLAERNRAVEAEQRARRELARNLHDGATQLVSSIKMRLDYCKLLLAKDPAKLTQEIDNTQALADQAIYEIRTLLLELRPLPLKMGLEVAVQIFLERRQIEAEGKTNLSLEIKTSQTDGKISRQEARMESALFAIVQESVNNALKHAQANNIKVYLKETPTAIYVIITDDGIGFEAQQIMTEAEKRGSMGMINLRERAQLIGGEIKLSSTPGHGTHITVYVPKAKEEIKGRKVTRLLSLPSNHKDIK